MRKERVLLEDGVDGAFERWQQGERLAVHEDLAAGGMFEPGDHPEGGGLSGARGAEQSQELAGCDFERDVVDRGEPGAEALGDGSEFEDGGVMGSERVKW